MRYNKYKKNFHKRDKYPRDEGMTVTVRQIKYKDGTSKTIKVLCRIDTENEIEYYKNGGILQYVLRNMIN